MSRYRIKGIKNAHPISTTLSAKNLTEAEQKAQKIQITPISITLQQSFWRSKSPKEELIACFEQISLLLQSSLPLDEILQHCANISHPHLQGLLLQTKDGLQEGKTLPQSFEAFGQLLTPLHYALLEVGSKTGRLQENFLLIAKDLGQKHEFNKRLKKALFYPFIVLLGVVITFFCAVILIIPEFEKLFSEKTLPFPTKSLIYLEHFLFHYGIFTLSFLAFLLLILRIFIKKSQKLRLFFHQSILDLPFFGHALLSRYLQNFFQSLYFFQNAGVDLQKGLQVSLETLHNSALQDAFSQMCRGLTEGSRLSVVSAQNKYLDSISTALLASGEQSGNLEHAFLHIAKYYEKKGMEIMDKILRSIEPFATVLMAAMVLYLALGIFLPIWDLQSAL